MYNTLKMSLNLSSNIYISIESGVTGEIFDLHKLYF